MTTTHLQTSVPCDDDVMAAIVNALNGPDEHALALINEALARWPQDHRLWFLRASIYAGQERRAEARVDFSQTLALAPDNDVARFMLGFLELLEQRVQDAALVWAPLDRLEETDALRLFKSGLLDLSEDRFEIALWQLKKGLELNDRNPAINGYVEAVVARIEAMPASERGAASPSNEAPDSHLLLSGYQISPTRH
jgi:tetratricopeptide (TPR) repeat protein